MAASLELTLAPDRRAAASARRRVRDELGDVLGPPLLERAELLLSELITNSVRHAGLSRERREDGIEVSVRAAPGYVWACVRDSGPGFTPRPRRPRDLREGGWGLYLLDRIAGRWGVSRAPRPAVWFELGGAPTENGEGDGRVDR